MNFLKTNSCKDCPYKECLMRTDKKFELCPVEAKKQKHNENYDKK